MWAGILFREIVVFETLKLLNTEVLLVQSEDKLIENILTGDFS